jgi:hypothetical protein
MNHKSENAASSKEPNSSNPCNIGQHRLQNGYTEFKLGILAPNMPNPFTSAPAHCCACAQTIGKDQVGEKRLFRGKYEIVHGPPPIGLSLSYEAPGILCSRCSSQGYHVGDFMQVGVQKRESFSNLVLQVGNKEVAAIWRSHFDRFADAISRAMKESPKLKSLAGVRCGATSERRLNPSGEKWVPPLQSDTRCFVVSACYGNVDCPEVVALRRFRDEILLQSKLGAHAVDAYYRISPPFADWLRLNPFIRKLVRRCVLQPIVKMITSHRLVRK